MTSCESTTDSPSSPQTTEDNLNQVLETCNDDLSEIDTAMEDPEAESLSRSIFVSNLHYRVTPKELKAFFKSCGGIERVTIPEDKFGHHKGYAYLEFSEAESVQLAL
jgi:RNA recognition motif-containing protein